MLYNNPQALHRLLTSAARLSLRALAIGLLLCLFMVASALAQSTYSDSWIAGPSYSDGNIVASDTDSSAMSIIGSGVTDGSYTDTYYVTTTLNGPTGVTTAQNSAPSAGYARVDVSIPF
jgi:hypothetical protein